MEKLTDALKNSEKVKTIYATKDDKILLVENIHGVLFVVNGKYVGTENLGYQWSFPIIPNLQTGSGMMGTGGCWDYIEFDKILKIVESVENYQIPNFFGKKEKESVKFYKDAKHKAERPGSIWEKLIK